MKLLSVKRFGVGINLNIFDKVAQENDINIGFLIRVNCTEALEPQEVIPSKVGGPLAFSSPLVWCVVGHLTNVNKRDAISCNIIVAQDAVLGNCASYHFGVLNEIKDVSAKQMFLMCNTKFCETSLMMLDIIP